jgi:hypothetical protein
MPDKITMTSARLESFKRGHDGGVAQFASSWNQKVADALDWPDDIPQALTGANLEGDLHATSCELIPSEGALKKHGIDLEINRVTKFEAVRLELEGKKGKGYRTELRFKVHFTDKAGARKLEQYLLTIGEGKGSLTVSYTRQEALPLEQEQATAPEAD